MSDEIINTNLLRKVISLKCDARAARVLFRANVLYVGHLCQLGEEYILSIPSFGPFLLNKVKKALSDINLELGMNIPDFPIDPVENVDKRYLVIKTLFKDRIFIKQAIIDDEEFRGNRQKLARKINYYAIKYKIWLKGLPVEVLIEDLRMLEDDNNVFSDLLIRIVREYQSMLKHRADYNWNWVFLRNDI